MTGAEMLREYLSAKGRESGEDAVEIAPFGDTPELAARLLDLIRTGKKRATCWARLGGEEPPAAGGLTVVTDWDGGAGCVLETVRARVLRFSEVPWDLARKEGEDECFRTWREEHIRFFTEESRREGYAFSEDMEIIFEEFRVVWPEEYADEK